MTIEALWERLEVIAKRHGRSLRLRTGVSEAALAAAEATMSLAIPADLRASLALHDGQDDAEDDTFPWMAGCSPLRSLAECVEQWKVQVGLVVPDDDFSGQDPPDPRLRPNLALAERIPIAGNRWWDQGNTFVDLAPGPEGTVGQLISFSSECELEVLGTSFAEALEAFVGGLEKGTLLYDPHCNDVVPARIDRPGNHAYEFAKWRDGR